MHHAAVFDSCIGTIRHIFLLCTPIFVLSVCLILYRRRRRMTSLRRKEPRSQDSDESSTRLPFSCPDPWRTGSVERYRKRGLGPKQRLRRSADRTNTASMPTSLVNNSPHQQLNTGIDELSCDIASGIKECVVHGITLAKLSIILFAREGSRLAVQAERYRRMTPERGTGVYGGIPTAK